MTGLTVTYRVLTWNDLHGRAVMAEGICPPSSSRPGKPPDPAPPTRQASKAARTLALAHHIERLVQANVLENYAQAARTLGISRPRLAQIMILVNLSPDLQGDVLQGGLRLSQRSLRARAADPRWTAPRP